MQQLIINVPDNKLAFFKELIQSLGFAQSEPVNKSTDDTIPEWQMLLALKEKENIEQGNTELKNWNDVRNSFNFKS